MRLFRRLPLASPNSISMMVWVMAPIAMKIVVTPKKIRNELKIRAPRVMGWISPYPTVVIVVSVM